MHDMGIVNVATVLYQGADEMLRLAAAGAYEYAVAGLY
jgi:hypothetical protein